MKSQIFSVVDLFSNVIKAGYVLKNEIGETVSTIEFPTLYINKNDWQGIWVGKQFSDGVIIKSDSQEYFTVYTYLTKRRWWYDDVSFSILNKDKKEIISGQWSVAMPTNKQEFLFLL